MSKQKALGVSRIACCSPRFIVYMMMLFIASNLVNFVHAKPCENSDDFDNQEYQSVGEQYSKPSEGHNRISWIKDQMSLDSAEDDEEDVVDREDHVTQYLSELLVNTDNEITMLQANDNDAQEESLNSEQREDAFFEFVTGTGKVLHIDGVWSYPADSAVDDSDN